MAHEPLSQAKADPQKGLLGTRLVINRCPFSLPSSLCSWHALRRSSLNKSANMLAASRMLLAGCCFQKTFMEPAPHNMELNRDSVTFLFLLDPILLVLFAGPSPELLAGCASGRKFSHRTWPTHQSPGAVIAALFDRVPYHAKKGHAAILCDWRFIISKNVHKMLQSFL